MYKPCYENHYHAKNSLICLTISYAIIFVCCCDLKTAIHAEGEQTRALITENTIQSLRDALQSTQSLLNASAQTQNIVNQLRPVPIPAYITCSPYASAYNGYGYGYNNNCGCGCGCGCN